MDTNKDIPDPDAVRLFAFIGVHSRLNDFLPVPRQKASAAAEAMEDKPGGMKNAENGLIFGACTTLYTLIFRKSTLLRLHVALPQWFAHAKIFSKKVAIFPRWEYGPPGLCETHPKMKTSNNQHRTSKSEWGRKQHLPVRMPSPARTGCETASKRHPKAKPQPGKGTGFGRKMGAERWSEFPIFLPPFFCQKVRCLTALPAEPRGIGRPDSVGTRDFFASFALLGGHFPVFLVGGKACVVPEKAVGYRP